VSATQDRKLAQAAAALAAGEHAVAERLLRKVLRREPRHPGALSWLGIALASSGRQAESLECFRRAVAVDPQAPGMHLNLGNALIKAGAVDQAVASFNQALALRPDYPEALNSLGQAHAQLGSRELAVEWLRRALALRPDYAEAHNNLGEVLLRLDRVEEAVASFRSAIALKPGDADFQCDLGIALSLQQRWEEAILQYQRALALDPAFADAHYNLGNAWLGQQRWAQAIAHYERALTLDPAFADAHYNLGLARLYRQEFESGWRGYERRLECAESRGSARKDAASVALYERLPRWLGPADTATREVAIWAEQGIGDQLLFSTLLPELAGTGAPFVYEVDRRLLGAYERAFPAQRFVPQEEPPREVLQRASRVLLAGSLPRYFRTSVESFGRQPAKLLSALPGRTDYYRTQLAALGPGLKVALSWRSSRKVRSAPDKSAPLEQLAPLLGLEGTRFVDVQYGDTAAERRLAEDASGARLLRFDDVDFYSDLDEMLAILEACDLVITTSNATAHFAGALGKRAWLLYLADQAPFHYWAHGDRHRSLWYPSVEIVTAPHLADWRSLAAHAAEKLRTVEHIIQTI